MTDPELIRLAVQASGKTVGEYARTVLIRDPRTVRRWLAGEQPLPEAVRAYLLQQVTP